MESKQTKNIIANTTFGMKIFNSKNPVFDIEPTKPISPYIVFGLLGAIGVLGFFFPVHTIFGLLLLIFITSGR